MIGNLDVLRMARELAAHAATRQGAISRNVANADTPRYQTQDVPNFSDIWRGSDGVTMRATRASHLDAGQAQKMRAVPQRDPGSREPNGNSVSLELEMVKAAEVRHQHELALTIYRSASTVLRTSLAR